MSDSTVDEVVAVEMKNHGIIGRSIAIIDKGDIAEAKGYGDKRGTIPITANRLFQAAPIDRCGRAPNV